jgi:hypothetical protein
MLPAAGRHDEAKLFAIFISFWLYIEIISNETYELGIIRSFFGYHISQSWHLTISHLAIAYHYLVLQINAEETI